jgi:small nuclear ribonucleoprotein (snRNP)-like protein
LLEEKRRRAIDIHLNYIVDQTEKYSSWLMEGFNGPSPSDITSGSVYIRGIYIVYCLH